MNTLMFLGGLLIMIAASYIIAKACDYFEISADFLGRNLSDGVKGSTINAIASSMPELLTTVFFLAFASQANLGNNLAASIAGDAGSAIFNSIIIPIFVILTVIKLGITSGANVSKKVILRDGIFLIAAELLLLILLSTSIITATHGIILVLFYIGYLSFTLYSTRSQNKYNEVIPTDVNITGDHSEIWGIAKRFKRISIFPYITPKKSMSIVSWIILSLSVIIISASCAGLVHATEMISEALNLNMMFVALILVAAASSVPDTIISIRDAKKGNHDDALGNVWGSNIFDITISMGLPLAGYLLITGQTIDFSEASSSLVDLRVMLLFITSITVCVFYFSKSLGKYQIWLLSTLYVMFIMYCIGGAYPETIIGDVVTSIKDVLHKNVEPYLYAINSFFGL